MHPEVNPTDELILKIANRYSVKYGECRLAFELFSAMGKSDSEALNYLEVSAKAAIQTSSPVMAPFFPFVAPYGTAQLFAAEMVGDDELDEQISEAVSKQPTWNEEPDEEFNFDADEFNVYTYLESQAIWARADVDIEGVTRSYIVNGCGIHEIQKAWNLELTNGIVTFIETPQGEYYPMCHSAEGSYCPLNLKEVLEILKRLNGL